MESLSMYKTYDALANVLVFQSARNMLMAISCGFPLELRTVLMETAAKFDALYTTALACMGQARQLANSLERDIARDSVLCHRHRQTIEGLLHPFVMFRFNLTDKQFDRALSSYHLDISPQGPMHEALAQKLQRVQQIEAVVSTCEASTIPTFNATFQGLGDASAAAETFQGLGDAFAAAKPLKIMVADLAAAVTNMCRAVRDQIYFAKNRIDVRHHQQCQLKCLNDSMARLQRQHDRLKGRLTNVPLPPPKRQKRSSTGGRKDQGHSAEVTVHTQPKVGSQGNPPRHL